MAVELLKIGGSDEGGRQCRLRLSSHESPNRVISTLSASISFYFVRNDVDMCF